MLLTIEKLIYGGDGLARLPSGDGRAKAVFLPLVLAGEKVEATLTEEKPAFARARATEIVEPSTLRVPPPCPYFGPCGGCHYQHAAYPHQREIKAEILRENLRRIAKLELQCEIQVHPSPPFNYRNRSRLQVRTQPQFAAGYFKLSSHELLPVEECPISSPLINRGMAALWQLGRAGKIAEGVQEVEFFANAEDSLLLVELLCAPEARRAAVRACAEDFSAALPEIAGITGFREAQKGKASPLLTLGASELIYQTKIAPYRVSARSFFQTNRFLIDELVQIVTAGRSGDLALDLYAGVGLFSTALANFRHIVSVESSQTSAADLQHNLPSNARAVHATAEQFLLQPGSKAGTKAKIGNGAGLPQLHRHPDLVVVDPPRAGLGDRVARALASSNAPQVAYVSCDPATLARDLVPLQAAGYRIAEIHLVDLFPQTFHLETVVHLTR